MDSNPSYHYKVTLLLPYFILQRFGEKPHSNNPSSSRHMVWFTIPSPHGTICNMVNLVISVGTFRCYQLALHLRVKHYHLKFNHQRDPWFRIYHPSIRFGFQFVDVYRSLPRFHLKYFHRP